jgi:type II secretory pathway component GspD/PulD (secretin)
MAPLPEDAASGKSLLVDVFFAKTKEALEQPSPTELMALQRDGKLASNANVRLLLLENLPGFTQFGELANKVAGVTATNTRVVPIYNAVNVGTIVQATGRVADDGTILLQIYIEKSELEPSDEPPETRKPEDITRLLAQSTVRLKPGEPVVLSSGPAGSSDTKSQNWIVLSCRTL